MDASEESDSLATSGASLRCRATRQSQKAHAEQQQRARLLHPQPRARHALVPKYCKESRGLLQAQKCQPDWVPEFYVRPRNNIPALATRHR